jgi:WD40 repeat protein
MLAAVTWSGVLQIWDTSTWKEVAKFHASPYGAGSLAFSADGKTLAVSDNGGDVYLWNIATQRELIRLRLSGPPNWTGHPSFSHNGKSLGVFGHRGNSPEFWIWNTHTPEREFTQPVTMR